MQVDFGFIQNYNPANGLGTISHSLRIPDRPNMLAVFHADQAKDKLPELYSRLQKGSFRGIRVFYLTQLVGSEDRVEELWLQGHEIPSTYCDQFLELLEKIWLDVEAEKPNWLDSITKSLGGMKFYQKMIDAREKVNQEKSRRLAEAHRQEEERQREANQLILKEIRKLEERQREAARQASLEREKRELERLAMLEAEQKAAQEALDRQREAERQARAEKIRRFCQTHEIENLVHFSRVENLAGILINGLLSRESLELETQPEAVFFNDDVRMDGRRNAVCLSISFPNFMMFYRLRQTNPGGWVVLVLDPAILWELDCAFCHENAASNNIRHIPLQERKKFEALERMYADHPLNPRNNLAIPAGYPTHPQAEVLVFQPIPVDYIREVHFSNITQVQDWNAHHTHVSRQLLVVSGQYFTYRSDYAAWQAPEMAEENDALFVEDFPFFGPPEGYVPFDDDEFLF